MTISVFKDYEIFDVGNKIDVEFLCEKIDIVENKVTLDISRCIIDYPATSVLLDKVLVDLSTKIGKKEFIIITNLNINEWLLLHWLFIGSKFFEINESMKKGTLDTFKNIIENKLSLNKVTLKIKILNNKNVNIETYTYK